MPFLMVLENFRPADGNTFFVGNSDWEKDLYRHRLEGVFITEPYNMQHIYSPAGNGIMGFVCSPRHKSRTLPLGSTSPAWTVGESKNATAKQHRLKIHTDSGHVFELPGR
ncbi:hypothetical protein FN846DRAFT_615650 [Sphaerosporella brunnea]|uniref:Uncharacterized protein n=1 Tax=Sphaerosporella brunnea TaxID=1250544 RepID=A0A5J5F199_9PEZI|nr:hypothetical protein FN846DRAFT_615650 [Sphaerosporella brunnea]